MPRVLVIDEEAMTRMSCVEGMKSLNIYIHERMSQEEAKMFSMLRKAMIITIFIPILCSSFISLDVNGTANAAQLIKDDLQADTTGTWVNSSGTNEYLGQSRYAKTPSTAIYKWTDVNWNEVYIYVWWSGHPNRPSNAPFSYWVDGLLGWCEVLPHSPILVFNCKSSFI